MDIIFSCAWFSLLGKSLCKICFKMSKQALGQTRHSCMCFKEVWTSPLQRLKDIFQVMRICRLNSCRSLMSGLSLPKKNCAFGGGVQVPFSKSGWWSSLENLLSNVSAAPKLWRQMAIAHALTKHSSFLTNIWDICGGERIQTVSRTVISNSFPIPYPIV